MKYDFGMTLAKLSAEELARRIEEKYLQGWEIYAVKYDCTSFIKSSPKRITAYVELGEPPTEDKKALYKDFGWEYVSDFSLYSVYINDSESPYPIQTDLREAAKAAEKSAYSTIGSILTFFFVYMLINLGAAFYFYYRNSPSSLAPLVIFDIPYLLYSFYYMARIAKAGVNAGLELCGKCGLNTDKLRRYYRLSVILSVCFLVITEIICVGAVLGFFSEII